ncbi:MAG: hypothetical protein KDN19_02080 [Verrucomicrobiae bacterium]|nr:hypothetical protein [Verrucomicrobiae bacterium]
MSRRFLPATLLCLAWSSFAAKNATANQDTLETVARRIVLPKIELNEVPLRKALQQIRSLSIQEDDQPDPSIRGIDIVLLARAPEENATKVSLHRLGISVDQAVKLVAAQAGHQSYYEWNAVVVATPKRYAALTRHRDQRSAKADFRMERQLKMIIFPKFSANGRSLTAVLGEIEESSKQLASVPEPAVRFDWNLPKGKLDQTIELDCAAMPLWSLIDYVAAISDIDFEIRPGEIMFHPN